MTNKNHKNESLKLEDEKSGLRSLMAEATGTSYKAYKSLEEARSDSNGIVILEGDYGGQIYVVAHAKDVKCKENHLVALLEFLDRLEWDDPDGANIYYESRSESGGVAGGMGGGAVTNGIWIHPRLQPHAELIAEILSGTREHLPE